MLIGALGACGGGSNDDDDLTTLFLLLALSRSTTPTSTATVRVTNNSGASEYYTLHTYTGTCASLGSARFTIGDVANGSSGSVSDVTLGTYSIGYKTPYSTNCVVGSFAFTTAGRTYTCTSSTTTITCS